MDDTAEVRDDAQAQEQQPAEVGQPTQTVTLTKEDIREAISESLAEYAKSQEGAKAAAKAGEEVHTVTLDGSQYATIEGTCQWSIYLSLMAVLLLGMLVGLGLTGMLVKGWR